MTAEKPDQPRLSGPFNQARAHAVRLLWSFAAAIGISGASPAAEVGDPKHAIDKTVLLKHVANSFRAGRIDLYQAALLLEINCNRPPENKVDHPLKIIALHNDPSIDFSHKTGELLRPLLEDYPYEELLASGILLKPSDQLLTDKTGRSNFTLEDMHRDNGIHLAEPQAKHSDGEGKDELVSKNLVGPDLYQKTFSAIPKAIFLELVTAAMKADRMTYMQATMMFSVNAHSLETRKHGNRRYLDHPMAVANDPALTKDQKFLALIHDVIENSNYTLDDFRKAQLPEYMIYAIDGVTIRADEKDDYEEASIERLRELSQQDPYEIKNYYSFIERCSLNFHASAVKQADIRHNLSDNPKPHKVAEYKLALAYLQAVDRSEIKPGSSLREWAQSNADENIRAYYDAAIQRRYEKLHVSLASAELANEMLVIGPRLSNPLSIAYHEDLEKGVVKAGVPIREWAKKHKDPNMLAYHDAAIERRQSELDAGSSQRPVGRVNGTHDHNGSPQSLLNAGFAVARTAALPISPVPYTPGNDSPDAAPGFGVTR